MSDSSTLTPLSHEWPMVVHAWLHSCIYVALYQSRRNDRDRDYEYDRGIRHGNALPMLALCVSRLLLMMM